MAWINVTNIPTSQWPAGNWIITWTLGIGWVWQRRDEDEVQACFEDPEVECMMGRFKAAMAKRKGAPVAR